MKSAKPRMSKMKDKKDDMKMMRGMIKKSESKDKIQDRKMMKKGIK